MAVAILIPDVFDKKMLHSIISRELLVHHAASRVK
jgi:hypothetical protein